MPAVTAGLLGKLSGHVLGPLLGAFATVAASRVIWTRAGCVAFPKPFAFIIQCLAAILLGVRITPGIGGLIISRAAPLAAAVVFVLAAGLFIAFILHRVFGWHKALSWMAAATVRQVYFTLFVSVVMVFL